MAGKRIQPPKGDYARGDNTLEFRLKDPQLERVALEADGSESSLERFRRYFSDFYLFHTKDPAGLNYEAFVRNIRAGGFITLGRQEVDLFFTRSSAFLVFHEIPDFGFLKERFPGVDFIGKVSIAKPLFKGVPIALIRLTGAELGALLSPKSMTDPMEQELSLQSLALFSDMLSQCRVEWAKPGFSIIPFVHGVEICRHMDDGTGARCYFVALRGDEEHAAYVISTDRQDAVCRLNYRGAAYYIKPADYV